jgi:alpha-L-rhamnosidase
LKDGFGQWRSSAKVPVEPLKLVSLPAVKLLDRNVEMPDYTVVRPVSIFASGAIGLQKPNKYKKDRSLVNISDQLRGYKESELEVLPSLTVQEFTNKSRDTLARTFTGEPFKLSENRFCTLDMGINLSGFIGSEISCTEPVTVYFYFDEILTDGDVNAKKHMGGTNNYLVYELEPLGKTDRLFGENPWRIQTEN